MTASPMVLAHLTLLHVPPPRLVEIAAQAGYDALTLQVTRPLPGLGPQTAYPILDGSAMLREVLARLADTGLRVHDIQALRLRDDSHIPDFAPVLEAGAQLGARYAVTVCDINEQAEAADAVARLADLAAPYGINIVLEFMAYSGVKSIGAAQRVLRQAGRANAMLMLDALHLARSGGTVDDVAAADPWLIPYLQICDAPLSGPAQPDGLRTEALTRRLFPGEGELPLVELLDVLPAGITLSVETPVAAPHFGRADLEIARMALAHTRAVQRWQLRSRA